MEESCIELGINAQLRPMTVDAIRHLGGSVLGRLCWYRISGERNPRGVCFFTEQGDTYVHPQITTPDALTSWGTVRVGLRSDALVVLQDADPMQVPLAEAKFYEPECTNIDMVIMLVTHIANPGVCAREISCKGPAFAQLALRQAVLLRNTRDQDGEPELWCGACYDAQRLAVHARLLIDGRRMGYRTPVMLTQEPPR